MKRILLFLSISVVYSSLSYAMAPFSGGSALKGAAAMQAARQYFGLAHSNVSERFKPQLLDLSNQELMKAMKNGVKVDTGVKKFSGSGLRGIGLPTPIRLMRASNSSFNQQEVKDNQKLFLARQALKNRDFDRFVELNKSLSEEHRKELEMWSKVDLLHQLSKKIEQVGHSVDGLTLENQFKALLKKLLFFVVGAGTTGYIMSQALIFSIADVVAIDIMNFGLEQAEKDIQILEKLLTDEEFLVLENQLLNVLRHIKNFLVGVKAPSLLVNQFTKFEQYVDKLRSEKLSMYRQNVQSQIFERKQDQKLLQEELDQYQVERLEAMVSGEPIVLPPYYEITQSDHELFQKTFKDYFNVKLFPDIMQSNFMQNQVLPITQQKLHDQHGRNVSQSEVVDALQVAMNDMLDKSLDKGSDSVIITE